MREAPRARFERVRRCSRATARRGSRGTGHANVLSPMPRRALLLSVVAVLASVLGASCLSPTLPLPPPGFPDRITLNDDGTWVVSGSCTKGKDSPTVVTVVNQKTGEGAVFEDRSPDDEDCSYSVVIEGDECDPAYVKEFVDDQPSSPMNFFLSAHAPGESENQTACQ